MNLNGRVAVITGGAGHIGYAAVEALAELGASVVVVDVDERQCQKASQEIAQNYEVKTWPLVLDLKDENAARSVGDKVLERFGRLDILINNAALVGTSELKGWAVPFGEQRSDAWRLALEVNLTVPFVITQACADALAVHDCGSVINIGSIYGVVGPNLSLYEGTSMGNPAAYAASKGGLIQLTRWLATVLAPKVRVNAITPGGVWRNQPEAFHGRYKKLTPLGRMAKEEDFKGAVAYLASDLSAYVTGHNLVVDGGWTAW
ncbi:MAG: SDR family oxidoreductase [Elusimicrobia bacterium]|nr:SDR family oxidoreductase [Elusimicrobiota bacterium]